MQRYKKFLLLVSIVAMIFMSGARPAALSSAKSGEPRRIRFAVAAFAESNGQRNLVSETTVDGPAGTDFNIDLHDSRFQMKAKFTTDLVASGTLKIKAELNTRRLYGYSERSLPLYEEDERKETMLVALGEKLVLLPFGGNDSNEQFKIEITPALSEQSNYLASGKPRELEINIPKPSPGGAITVEAHKVPHDYLVEATLLEEGREVARGAAPYHLGEPTELLLQAGPQAGSSIRNDQLAINFTVNRYSTSGAGQVAFGFSVYRRDQQGNKGEVMLPQAAGIGDLGSTFKYELGELANGKKYQLNLKVKLSPGESQN